MKKTRAKFDIREIDVMTSVSTALFFGAMGGATYHPKTLSLILLISLVSVAGVLMFDLMFFHKIQEWKEDKEKEHDENH